MARICQLYGVTLLGTSMSLGCLITSIVLPHWFDGNKHNFHYGLWKYCQNGVCQNIIAVIKLEGRLGLKL